MWVFRRLTRTVFTVWWQWPAFQVLYSQACRSRGRPGQKGAADGVDTSKRASAGDSQAAGPRNDSNEAQYCSITSPRRIRDGREKGWWKRISAWHLRKFFVCWGPQNINWPKQGVSRAKARAPSQTYYQLWKLAWFTERQSRADYAAAGRTCFDSH